MNTPPLPTPEASAIWFYADAQGNPVGPLPFAELQALSAKGGITPETYVIQQGETAWKTYGEVARSFLPPPVPASPKGTKTPRRWPAVLCVLLFYPLGLIALWVSRGFSQRQKLLMTAISGGLFLAFILLNAPNLVLLAFIANAILFTWWAERLGKAWKIALTVIISVFLLPATFVPAKGYTPRPSSDTANTHANNSAEAEAPKGKSERVEIGQPFRLGDFTYTIQRWVGTSALGSSYNVTKPSSGAVFLVVYYSIQNESNKTKTVVADDFLLRDSLGREFRPASDAVTALIMSGHQKDFLLSELQPGIEKQSVTAFEVPMASLKGELRLIVPEKGWGSGKREVQLQETSASSN